MGDKLKVKEYLSRNYIQNIPAIEALKKDSTEVIAFDPAGGAILYNRARDLLFISVEDNRLLDNINQYITPDHTGILSLREESVQYINAKVNAVRVAYCYQVVFNTSIEINSSLSLDIRVLDVSFTDIVYDNYTLKLDKEYIVDRLANGCIYGAFIKDNFAGFIGIHDEGSIGFLEVLPEYRRQGIATILLSFMIDKVKASGNIPFSFIYHENTASLNLARNYPNAIIAPEKIAWVII